MEKTAYCQKIPMYVYEETVDGKKLTDIINTEHENVKYLPGTKLPHNIVSIRFQVMDPVGIISGLVCNDM